MSVCLGDVNIFVCIIQILTTFLIAVTSASAVVTIIEIIRYKRLNVIVVSVRKGNSVFDRVTATLLLEVPDAIKDNNHQLIPPEEQIDRFVAILLNASGEDKHHARIAIISLHRAMELA